MIAPLYLETIAQISAARILNCLAEGTLIAIFAAGLLCVARRLTSGTRFAVWFSALMAMASLALLGNRGWSHGGASNVVAAVRPALVLPESWALYLSVLWAAIAALLLARVGVGILEVRRVRKSCVPLDPTLVDGGLQDKLQLCGKTRRVALCTSDLVSVPTAIGFVRPTVVLPTWLTDELSPAELKQVVLHELAHLLRWDDWTNLVQKIVKALLFFHPAVWWIEKHISLEREMACDDAVLAETANPRAYAECLAHLAEMSMVRRGLALAQAALGRLRQTSMRVKRILHGDRPAATKHGWMLAVSAVTGVAIACGAAVSRAPRLIAFTHNQPQIVATRLPLSPPGGLAQPATAAVNRPVVHSAATVFGKAKPRVVEAKARNVQSMRSGYAAARIENALTSEPNVVEPACWTEFSARVRVTQAVYVVVASREYLPSGQVLYRESVWSITALPQPHRPNTRVPPKQV